MAGDTSAFCGTKTPRVDTISFADNASAAGGSRVTTTTIPKASILQTGAEPLNAVISGQIEGLQTDKKLTVKVKIDGNTVHEKDYDNGALGIEGFNVNPESTIEITGTNDNEAGNVTISQFRLGVNVGKINANC